MTISVNNFLARLCTFFGLPRNLFRWNLIIFFLVAFFQLKEIGKIEALVRTGNEVELSSAELLPTVIGMLEEIRKNRVDIAYEEFTSTLFRKATSLEKFKNFIKKYPILEKNRTFQFHSFYVEDQIATFEGAIISLTSDEMRVEFDIVNEHGKWKILGIQLFNAETTTSRPEKLGFIK
jgi:Domain of unknown function (DUF4864)